MFANGPKLVTQGLNLLVDAGDPTSYPGSGTTWRDVVGGQNGTITGSVSYSSAFYGGLVFSGPTASVIFPTSSANFGTGSFTVELAFRPERIQGIHYLISKNSGSFPSWGVYLSGSGGSGKLFSEFRISSTVSCSVSSSSTFVTGSNYQVDVRILPASSASGFYVDGVSIGGGSGNGGGSLTSTGSLFLGNFAPSSSQAFSGSLFTTKVYSLNTLTQPVQNYNAFAPRLSKPPITAAIPTFELLVVAGGGSGGTGRSGGGGGAGGLQYLSSYTPVIGNSTVIVGAGGQNSNIDTYISIAGGRGGILAAGLNGGSGGGGGGGATSGGSGTVGQGNNGGDSTSTSQWTSGGGGGAGTAGSPNNGNTNSGAGGSGSFIASFAAIGGLPAGWFAGGGGGGTDSIRPIASGGFGGGGNGGFGSTAGNTGSANTGGGGGGSGNSSAAGSGGSGIVAIRYNGTPIAVGGEITQSEGYTYHVYRTVGTSSFTIF